MSYCRNLPKYKYKFDDSLSLNSSFVSVRSDTESDSKEACAMCAFSGKRNIREASYYCLSCNIFGRFICSSCIPRHTQETANHVLKHIPDFNENMSLNAWENADDAEKHKKETDELQKQVSEVTEKVIKLSEEKDKAENDLKETERELMACKSQLEKTEKSYSVTRSELMACESQVEKTEKSYSVTSTDADEAEGVTRTHRKYVKEQRKRTSENIRRCKDEKSQIEVELAEKRTKLLLLEKHIKDLEKKTKETGKQKHATNTKIAELTIEIDKLKEEKKKLQQEKDILFQTMDNINKKMSAEESARECLDRLDAVIGLNTTLLNKINMLEEQRHSIIGIKGAPLRYQPKRKVPEPLQLSDKL